MLFSMTGFGRYELKTSDKTVSVEIKSLNSKGSDIRVRSSLRLGDKEMTLRKMITDSLQRGKIDVIIEVEKLEDDANHSINIPLFKQYHQILQSLSTDLNINDPNMLQAILRIPAVVDSSNALISDEDWADIKDCFNKAVVHLKSFRQNEGNSIRKDFEESVHKISQALAEVGKYEQARIDKQKLRLDKLLSEHLGSENIDANRFEQEILYFLDKIDISEEKTRLSKHCHHFLEKLNDKKNQRKGRVLAFISQEMGREINTLGAKANSSDMQVLVVKMKEELEKIKEQILNTL